MMFWAAAAAVLAGFMPFSARAFEALNTILQMVEQGNLQHECSAVLRECQKVLMF
jgi:hypothetical protein